MRAWHALFAIGVILLSAGFVVAVIQPSDQVGTQTQGTPLNGTSNNSNISGRMQQYVGFYGRVTMEVRKTVGVGSVMYNKTVTQGKLYFIKNGENPDWTGLDVAKNNSNTDRNLSLTGYYVTGNHFVFNDSLLIGTERTTCNKSGDYLNTTDAYKIIVMCDAIGCAGSPKYFFCVDIADKLSANGYGVVQYEMITAKTPTYTSYDVYYDMEQAS
jgi:hypothetical protein